MEFTENFVQFIRQQFWAKLVSYILSLT